MLIGLVLPDIWKKLFDIPDGYLVALVILADGVVYSSSLVKFFPTSFQFGADFLMALLLVSALLSLTKSVCTILLSCIKFAVSVFRISVSSLIIEVFVELSSLSFALSSI